LKKRRKNLLFGGEGFQGMIPFNKKKKDEGKNDEKESHGQNQFGMKRNLEFLPFH